MSNKWLKLSDSDSSLKFKKELLPIGEFAKGKQEFTITKESAEVIVSETSRMNKNGVKTPLVHTHEGDEAFGNFEGYTIEPSQDYESEESIYGIVEFSDQKSRDFGLKHDVSVFIPETKVDGKKREYKVPIEHVALTAFPVIPGLNKWEKIAASFKTKESPIMKMETLAGLLQVDIKEKSEEEAEQLITAKLKSLMSSGGKKEKEEDDEEYKKLSQERDTLKAELNKFKNEGTKNTLEIPTLVLSSLADSRKTVLNSLAKEGIIDPNTRDNLENRYCDQKSLKLSLANDDNDGFDAVVELLKNNKPVSNTTNVNAIALSHGKREDNPMIKAANEIRERAGEKPVKV